MALKRFLKTIRFDRSDSFAFPQAAEPDEWAVPGTFAFSALPTEAITGKTKQAFANGFLGLTSFGHATFTSVANITDTELDNVEHRLANHFIERYGAPDRTEAVRAAREEIDFTRELVGDNLINELFVIQRTINDHGEIQETFRKLERRIDGGPIFLADAEDSLTQPAGERSQ